MINREDILYNRIKYLFDNSHNVGLICHKQPDGDALGSMIALRLLLEQEGKLVTTYCIDEVPDKFLYLPKVNEVCCLEKNLKKLSEHDLFISLDSGDLAMTGLINFEYMQYLGETPFINIDHHHDNACYGHLNLIYKDISSTSEIIYNIIERYELEINKQISTCIFTGIFTDTDSFKNPNITKRTLEISSKLLKCGADLKNVASSNVKDKSLRALKLWGKVFSRVRENEHFGIVSTVVTKEDIKECNATTEDVEGLANFLNSIPNAKASLVLRENEEGEIKGSLRTMKDEIDVSKLAAYMGGGGHRRAAGFHLKGRIKFTDGMWRIIV